MDQTASQPGLARARLESFHSLPPKALTGAGVCTAMLIKDSKPSAAKGRAPPALAPPAFLDGHHRVQSACVRDKQGGESKIKPCQASCTRHHPDLHLAERRAIGSVSSDAGLWMIGTRPR